MSVIFKYISDEGLTFFCRSSEFYNLFLRLKMLTSEEFYYYDFFFPCHTLDMKCNYNCILYVISLECHLNTSVLNLYMFLFQKSKIALIFILLLKIFLKSKCYHLDNFPLHSLVLELVMLMHFYL